VQLAKSSVLAAGKFGMPSPYCRAGASAVEAANNALDRLERDDPAQYDKLLRKRRSNK
jgi:hypothetical protein